MDNNGIALIGGIILAAFIYFIIKKIQASRNKPKSTGTGGGGGTGRPPKHTK